MTDGDKPLNGGWICAKHGIGYITQCPSCASQDTESVAKPIPKYMARLIYKSHRMHHDRSCLDLKVREWMQEHGIPDHKTWEVQSLIDADERPETILATIQGLLNT